MGRMRNRRQNRCLRRMACPYCKRSTKAGGCRRRIFWCGSVRASDGKIMEVHSFWEALRADFHTCFYFSEEQETKMDSGECVFFSVTQDGKVETDWLFPLKKGIISKIEKQIKVVRVKRPTEKEGRSERAGGFLFPRDGNQKADGNGGGFKWRRGQW